MPIDFNRKYSFDTFTFAFGINPDALLHLNTILSLVSTNCRIIVLFDKNQRLFAQIAILFKSDNK